MKYNIMGFYQPRAVELNLDNGDLLVLRWFVDYAGTGKMKTLISNNRVFYWVNYKTVLEELPILKISKQTLYKKHFTNLVNANVLEHENIKDGGNFSYYCYGINYDTLVYLEGGYVKNDDLMSNFTKGSVENYQTLVSNSTKQRLNHNTNNSIKDNILSADGNGVSVEKDIIDYLNQKCGTSFRYVDSNIKFIKARLTHYTPQDLKDVIDRQCGLWKGTNMQKYLRPETLFNATKFESYHNGLREKKDYKGSFVARDYGEKELNNLFDNIDEVNL